jgi:hypothetical protein
MRFEDLELQEITKNKRMQGFKRIFNVVWVIAFDQSKPFWSGFSERI